MAKVHVKVNDTVFVLNGKDAGKTGKVIRVLPHSGRVIVEGVNMVTKHERPNPQKKTGGLVTQEAAIDASNVMLVCPSCKRPSKTAVKILDNGDKVRYCKACGETIDTIFAKAK